MLEGVDPAELVTVDLTELECTILREGLGQWGGPGFCTAELARAIGFTSVAELRDAVPRLSDSLNESTTLTRLDWFRTLASAEIGFGSDIFGAGVEWPTVTGMSDTESLLALRLLQRKLIGVVAGLVRK